MYVWSFSSRDDQWIEQRSLSSSKAYPDQPRNGNEAHDSAYNQQEATSRKQRKNELWRRSARNGLQIVKYRSKATAVKCAIEESAKNVTMKPEAWKEIFHYQMISRQKASPTFGTNLFTYGFRLAYYNTFASKQASFKWKNYYLCY